MQRGKNHGKNTACTSMSNNDIGENSNVAEQALNSASPSFIIIHHHHHHHNESLQGAPYMGSAAPCNAMLIITHTKTNR